MPKVRPIELIIKGVNKVSGPIRDVNRKLESMERQGRRVSGAFRDLGKALRLPQLASGFRAVGKELTALGKRAALVGTVLGGAAFEGMRRFIAYGDEIGATASKFHVGVAALQELHYAAAQLDVDQGTLDSGIKFLSRSLSEAAGKPGPARQALQYLRVFKDIKDSSGKIRPAEDMLGRISDAMIRVKNPADRLRATLVLMGRGSVDMVNLMLAGSKEIDRLRRRAQELGLVLSNETVQAASDADNEIKDLVAISKGLGYAIASDLLPEVRPLIREMISWIQQNRGVIRTRIVENVVAFATAVRDTVPKVLAIVDAIGGWKTIAIVTGLAISASLIGSLVSLGATLAVSAVQLGLFAAGFLSVETALGAVLLLVNPFVAGGVAIAAVGVLLYKNFEPFRNMIDWIWERLKWISGLAFDQVKFEAKDVLRTVLPAGVGQAVGLGPQMAMAGGAPGPLNGPIPAQTLAIPPMGRNAMMQNMRVGGSVSVQVSAARGSNATVTDLKSLNPKVPMNVGTIMRGY